MFQNKKGEGYFMLILMVGVIMVIAYAGYAFADSNSPKKLTQNTGIVGSEIKNLNFESQKQEIILNKCLRNKDISVSKNLLSQNTCFQNNELIVSSTCPFDIKTDYLKMLSEEISSCINHPVNIDLLNDVLVVSFNQELYTSSDDFSISLKKPVVVTKSALVQINEINNKINQIKSSSCIKDGCIENVELDQNDAVFIFESEEFLTVENNQLKKDKLSINLRIKDYNQKVLFS